MTLLQIIKKRWVQVVSICVIVFAVIVSLLPVVIKMLVEDWYKEQGVESIKIANVDFNLFTGELSIESMEVVNNAKPVLSVKSATVDVSWLELFSKHVHIASVDFKEMLIDVDQQPGKPIIIAGISPLGGEAEKTPGTDVKQEAKSDWGFGISRVSIDNLVLNYKDAKIQTEFNLLKASLDNALTWMPDKSAKLDLSAELNGSPLQISAELTPFAKNPGIKAKIKIDDFNVQSVSAMAEPGLSTLSGKLSLDTELDVAMTGNKSISVKTKGKYQLDDSVIEAGDYSIQTGKLAIDGSLGLTHLLDAGRQDPTVIKFKGNTQTSALVVNNVNQKIRLADVGNLVFTNLDIKKLDSVFVDNIAITNLKLLDDDKKGQGSKPQPVVSVKSIETGTVQLSNLNNLVAEKLKLATFVADLNRNKQGKFPLLDRMSGGDAKATDETKSTADTKEEVSAVSESENSKEQSKPFQFKIGVIDVVDNSRVAFADASVVPKFESNIEIQVLKIKNVDSANENSETEIVFKGKPDKYSQIDVNGKIQPFSTNKEFSFNANIKDYDLARISSYTSQEMGYDIRSGLGTFDIKVAKVKEKVDGKVDLVLHNLTVKETDSKRMKDLNKKLSVPLSTALSTLRDKNDDIKLTIPVTGKLLEPDVDVGDVINTAMAKALKASSISYLKYMFQPYGTLITIVEMAGSVAGSVKLDPVLYEDGSADLDEEDKVYLQKMVKLMQERKEIRVQLCGTSTEQDRAALLAQPGKPANKTVSDDDLFALARQRAENIKDYLVTQKGIEPSRLFVCNPEIKSEGNAKPQVELLI